MKEIRVKHITDDFLESLYSLGKLYNIDDLSDTIKKAVIRCDELENAIVNYDNLKKKAELSEELQETHIKKSVELNDLNEKYEELINLVRQYARAEETRIDLFKSILDYAK